ncbi:MAG: hypothetical protein IJO11_06710 [Alphaproteobacteria bacterium]|nr:hypothetical protein [Alphaproteobacteria bacterium]
MNKWIRIALIGLIWGLIFLVWLVSRFLEINWNFHFFQLNDWAFLLDEFRKGWVINKASDVIFFIVLFSAIPLFLIGWRFFIKIEWLKLLRRNVNRLIYFLTGGESVLHKKQTGKIQLKKKSSKTTRPRAIDTGLRPATKDSELKVPVDEPSVPQKTTTAHNNSSYNSSSTGSSFNSSYGNSSGYGYTPPSDSPFNKGFNVPSMQQGLSASPAPSAMASFDDMLLEDIKLPERIKIEEDIPSLFERANYTVMKNVLFTGKPIDYLAISENRIIVAVVDPQTGDWLADEERFNGEDPLWFSESSHRVSPVFQLLELTKKLMNQLSAEGFSGSVMPMFIERTGMIINAEDMLTIWKDLSVIVCRTDIGGPDELKTVAQSIVAGEQPSEIVLQQVQKAIQGE